MTYAAATIDWLSEAGYSTCFFVAGGNIMHLLNAARGRMRCVPFVHEVGAGIAAEYFNEVGSPTDRAFVLVTAGPGVTNVLTAMAGAWLESRDLLVIAGQVKTTDLARGSVRQRGIQEIDGVAAAAPFCKLATLVDEQWSRDRFLTAIAVGTEARKGPVFLEYPLDIQGAPYDAPPSKCALSVGQRVPPSAIETGHLAVSDLVDRIRRAERPVLLIGGGVSRNATREVADRLRDASVALMTTWNGADRLDFDDANYFGRPNTWGMRFSNVLLQQADLIVAVGTRLGLQQTGFNWQAFGASADVIQVDIDRKELEKGHPRLTLGICADADAILTDLANADLGDHTQWLTFAREVRALLPVVEAANVTAAGFVDPYAFVSQLGARARADDVVVPCSSGGAFTTMMQAFPQRRGQTIVTDKGLASMGYGLAASIGASLALPDRRTILVEGDGGFTQNLQELATVDVNACSLKIFIYSNEGYASIRMTQRNYFDGAYLGCDVRSGLGFPRWPELFAAYGIAFTALGSDGLSGDAIDLFERAGPAAFLVPIDPEQTYYPKITSRVTASGSMESAPLDAMTPDLPAHIAARVFRYGLLACQPR